MSARRLGISIAGSLLICLAACRPTAPPPPPPPQATAPALPAACQRSQHVEEESPYVPPLSPLEELPEETDLCVSQQTLKTLGSAILAAKNNRPALPAQRWDHTSTPANLSLIDRRFALTAEEREHLLRDGLVVPQRLSDSDYVLALHEIFQSQLPLYVSADAILHAVYASNDKLLAQLEATLLSPRLDKLLEALHCALGASARDLPKDIARDVDLYLTVARSLLADKEVASLFEQGAAAKSLFEKAKAAAELVEYPLFGRGRMIDFSIYKPRGHYAANLKEESPSAADLSTYFRAVMWLSRIEWNLVSRSCVSSKRGPEVHATPREAAVAIALGRLIGHAKVEADIDAFDRAFALLAGKREDVPLPKLAELAQRAGIQSLEDPKLADKLREAIGNGYVRTARTHYAWEGCTDLPVIATLLGPRVVSDSAATRPLVHGEIPDRHMLHAADMAYALGHDRALTYLADDLQTFPALRQNLATARKLAHSVSGDALYDSWITAILKLAAPAPDHAALPSFMHSDAYSDLRINSAVAAFGQLRHNNVLMVANTYEEGGCTIPDAFVEPVPAVYDALIAYADRGGAVMRTLDPQDTTGSSSYFARLSSTLKILSMIARDELANRALTAEQKQFLGMVVEVTGSGRGTGGSPTFTGWYFALFRDRRDAFSGADFIADYYTSTELEQVAYVGVSEVRLGIFVVDIAGEPRAFIGPVARAFEHVGPLKDRLTDVAAARLPAAQRIDPWAASYSIKGAAEPPLTFIAHVKEAPDRTRTQQVTLEVFSTRSLGPVSIELIDHHRRPLARVTHPVGKTKTSFRFASRPVSQQNQSSGYEGIHVRVGSFDAWEVVIPSAQSGAPHDGIVDEYGRAYGGMPAVPVPMRREPM